MGQNSPMDPGRPGRTAWLVPFGLAVVIALELARPFHAGPVAFDSAASVVHFDRIVSGTPMEGYLSTTPKPLLTVVYGTLHAVLPDWRILSASAIAAFAAGVAAASVLALRVGGRAAWAFAAVALAGAPALLFDATLALGTAWALPLWAAAGLAVTADRPRYGLAGLALLLAALVRLETLVVVGVAALGLAAVQARSATGGPPVPRRAWLLLVGFGAVPAMMVHDLLLVGDPLFWTTVATHYSEATDLTVPTPAELAIAIGGHYLAVGGLAVLGVVGWAGLWARGRRGLALGMLGLGPGVIAFLVALSLRGVYVPERYLAPADVALAFSAAFAVPLLRVDLPDRWRNRTSRVPVALVAVAAIAVVVTGTWGPLAGDVRQAARRQLWVAEGEVRALPALRTAIRDAAAGPAGDEPVRVIGPRLVRPHLIVDLGLPIPAVGSIDPDAVDIGGGYPAAGQLVLYDQRATERSDALDALAVREPTPIDGVVVVPLAFDADRGWWLVRIDAAP